jgi:hypothetical protein
MNVTEGKCYSVAEMATLLEDVGFRQVRHEATAADRSIVTARKET